MNIIVIYIFLSFSSLSSLPFSVFFCGSNGLFNDRLYVFWIQNLRIVFLLLYSTLLYSILHIFYSFPTVTKVLLWLRFGSLFSLLSCIRFEKLFRIHVNKCWQNIFSIKQPRVFYLERNETKTHNRIELNRTEPNRAGPSQNVKNIFRWNWWKWNKIQQTHGLDTGISNASELRYWKHRFLFFFFVLASADETLVRMMNRIPNFHWINT